MQISVVAVCAKIVGGGRRYCLCTCRAGRFGATASGFFEACFQLLDKKLKGFDYKPEKAEDVEVDFFEETRIGVQHHQSSREYSNKKEYDEAVHG